MFKKKIPWMILFLLIAGLSIWAVTQQSKNFSLADFCAELQVMKKTWLVLAIVSMIGFIVFEGFAVAILIHGLTGRKLYLESITYGAADVYFSGITPSASGGQPASAFFMMADRIPAGTTTVILLVNLILYTYALLFYGIFAFLLRGHLYLGYPLFGRILILIGIVVLIALSLLFWILLLKEELIRHFGLLLIGLGCRLHLLHHPEKQKEKLFHMTEQYRLCADMVHGKKQMLLGAFLMNLMQRMSLSLVTLFCYLAMGGHPGNGITVWCVQIMTSLGSNSVPIPGSMGVADYMLLHGLEQLPDIVDPTNLELISRGLSFYTCIVVSILIIVIGYLRRKQKKKQEM